VIVATAGHIDHGKTLLVKCLTGTDTDRLPEEKARGISIELGFAYLPLADGGVIGFVDVPGHERFVRTMLAGVCAVDFALLVVAADDGVMPQTQEHLNILSLLNVEHGLVALTKIDRADREQIENAEGQIRELLASASRAHWRVVHVSAPDGRGIEELRSSLVAEAKRRAPGESSGRHFRYAVDRSFVSTGRGTVVTGTVFSGSLRVNDRVVISSNAKETRVRGIQVNGQAVQTVAPGERCALNLSNVSSSDVGRGDWVLDSAIRNTSLRLDVRLSLLPSEAQALKHWTPVHLHLGSAETGARVAIAGSGSIAVADSGYAQIVLTRPVSALHGDRFILRDQSASRTLGGGVVLDPVAGPIRRRDPTYRARLAALEAGDPAAVLQALLEVSTDGVNLDQFERMCNLKPNAAVTLYASLEMIVLGRNVRVGIGTERHASLQEVIVETLTQYHLQELDGVGLQIEALRKRLAPQMATDAFEALLESLATGAVIELDRSFVRLPGHARQLRPDDDSLWRSVEPALRSAGFTPPTVHHLALQLELDEQVLLKFLLRRTATGHVVKVAEDRFYLRPTIAHMASIARTTARATPDGSFTVAQYRDASGASRRAAIKVLERLDALGITYRTGDTRKLGRDFVPVFGHAPPTDIQ
jgi:selenocysteine-specific elongation factor